LLLVDLGELLAGAGDVRLSGRGDLGSERVEEGEEAGGDAVFWYREGRGKFNVRRSAKGEPSRLTLVGSDGFLDDVVAEGVAMSEVLSEDSRTGLVLLLDIVALLLRESLSSALDGLDVGESGSLDIL
jgi:hypothetical protein